MVDNFYIFGQYETPIRVEVYDAGPFFMAYAEDHGGLLTKGSFCRQVAKATGRRVQAAYPDGGGWVAELEKAPVGDFICR